MPGRPSPGCSLFCLSHILEHEDIITTRYARNPIGAGPFKLKSWEPGSRIVLEANDLYFKGRPYLDEVIYRIIPDSTTMFLEARAGKLDFIGLSPQQYLRQTSGEWWGEKLEQVQVPVIRLYVSRSESEESVLPG